jgi:hypothetical protein
MTKYLKYLLVVFTVLAAQKIIAQSFPVSITPTISSPYSPYLSDYTEPGSQKLAVNILLKDGRITDYRCKLRLTIEGVGITIRTRQSFIPQPISLMGGAPSLLYGEDLAEYFDPANLDFAGISKGGYMKGAKLPEGIYRFSFEVLDYNRGTTVSNKGTATAWIILNDPPMLTLPRKDTKVSIVDPANIVFNWTARHTGSPNSAFTTEYIFRLVEIWPAGRNPNDAFLSQQPLYEVTTNFTQLVYGPAEPALIAGRKYAWQIQAKDTEDKDLFKNAGKSEVYTFQFGDAIGVPNNFRQDGGNASVINLRWEPAPDGAIPQQYRVRYRRKGDTRGVWYENVTPQLWVPIPDLQRDTEYEMQVRAESKPQYSEYSPLQTLRTDAKDNVKYTCGAKEVINPVTNKNLLLTLAAGDVVTIRNFKLLITQVTGSGGIYTGTGWLKINWFNGAGIKVTFSGPVNTDYELMGPVESVYNQGSPGAQAIDDANNIGKDTDQYFKGKENATVTPDYTVSGTIDSIYVKGDGKIIVIDTEGNESSYDQKVDKKSGKVKDTTIADATGSAYTVNQDGTVSKKAGSAALASTIDLAQLDEFEKQVLDISNKFLSGVQNYKAQKN